MKPNHGRAGLFLGAASAGIVAGCCLVLFRIGLPESGEQPGSSPATMSSSVSESRRQLPVSRSSNGSPAVRASSSIPAILSVSTSKPVTSGIRRVAITTNGIGVASTSTNLELRSREAPRYPSISVEERNNRSTNRLARGPESIQAVLDSLEDFRSRQLTNFPEQVRLLGKLIDLFDARGELDAAHYWLEEYASAEIRARPDFLNMLGNVGKRLALQERWDAALTVFEEPVDPAAGSLPSYVFHQASRLTLLLSTGRQQGYREARPKILSQLLARVRAANRLIKESSAEHTLLCVAINMALASSPSEEVLQMVRELVAGMEWDLNEEQLAKRAAELRRPRVQEDRRIGDGTSPAAFTNATPVDLPRSRVPAPTRPDRRFSSPRFEIPERSGTRFSFPTLTGFTLGVVALREGKLEGAESRLLKAASGLDGLFDGFLPSYLEIYSALAMVKKGQGLEKEAQVWLDKASEWAGMTARSINTINCQSWYQAPAAIAIYSEANKLVRARTPDLRETSPVTSIAGPVWTNSLGMVFRRIPGSASSMSIWETRVDDYDRFVAATRRRTTQELRVWANGQWMVTNMNVRSLRFQFSPMHPIRGVRWEDADRFCDWLSKLENKRYRLPTNEEWSRAAGAFPPGDNNLVGIGVQTSGSDYPWGNEKLPVRQGQPLGNYAGEELVTQPWWGTTNHLVGFRDAYIKTSPVGQFAANPHGFYDLGGNVLEWVTKAGTRDAPGLSQGFLRGGDWLTSERDAMAINHEVALDIGTTTETCGFRVVLDE